MKTFVTVPIAGASSGAIRQPRSVCCRIEAPRSPLRRFQQFIESTDWEKRYLCHERIDKVCVGIIVVSLLYFAPVLGSGILR